LSYTAFVNDIFARRIVGWKVSHAMRTVLDALEQALHQRGPIGFVPPAEHETNYY